MKNLGEICLEESSITKVNAITETAIINLSAFKVVITQSKFENIRNDGGLGVFYLQSYIPFVDITIEHTIFTTIYSYFNAPIFACETLFFYNLRKKMDSSLLSNLDLKVLNCSMTDLSFGTAFSFSIINCRNCLIKDSTFNVIKNQVTGSLVNMLTDVSGSLEIINTQFSYPPKVTHPFARITNSKVKIIFNKINYNGDSYNKCYTQLIAMDSGSLFIQDSVFENLEMIQNSFISILPTDQARPNYNAEASLIPQIILNNVTIRSITYKGSKDYWNDEDMVRLLNYQMLDKQPSSFFLNRDLKFLYDKEHLEMAPSIIICMLPASITIQNSKFEDIKHMSTILSGYTPDWSYFGKKAVIEITDSEFKNIIYLFGPALNILPSSYCPTITITNTLFEDNFAYAGGALSIYSSQLTTINTTFKNNYATLLGSSMLLGGMTAFSYQKTGALFIDNKAFYGGPVQTQATGVKLKFYSLNQTMTTQILTHDKHDGWSLTLGNVSQIELTQGVLIMEFLGYDNDPTPSFAGEGSGTITIPANHVNNIKEKFPIEVRQSSMLSCNISLRYLIITGKAYVNSSLVLNYNSDQFTISKTINYWLRPCVAGEYNDTLVCQRCVFPTYSVDPTIPCTNCPQNAHCPNQSKVCPDPGYWNFNSSSSLIIPCRGDDIQRCVNDRSGCQQCAEGYNGPLCEACDFENGYVESGYLRCGKCSNPSKSLYYSIMIGIMYFAYQLFSVSAVYSANSKLTTNRNDYMVIRRVERSYYIKSLLTYTQIMGIIYIGNSSFYKLFGLSTQIGNPSTLIIYGTQCTLKALGIHYSDFLYYQTYFVLLSPVIQAIAILFVLILWDRLYERIPITQVLTAAIIYFVISYQPGIVTSLTQFLSCHGLESFPYNYVSSHPNWSCDEQRYQYANTYIVIPGFAIWCFIVPLTILVVLISRRNQQHTEKFSSTYGMLFFDLKDKFYYWGIALMVVKLILSFLIFGLERNNDARICSSLVLLWIYQGLVRAFNPYKTEAFNKFETLLMNLLMLNIISTKYLMDSSNGLIVSGGSLVVTVTLNGAFLAFAAWKILSLTFLNLVANVEKKIMNRRITRDERLLMSDNHMTL